MKLPLSWLNDYVKVDDIDPKDLAEKLTRAGLQVETIETVGGTPLPDRIVVAEVVGCEAHPNSDHLHVCKVTDGKETYQVVCGAPNMRLGIKTAFAKIGAEIPDFLDKNGILFNEEGDKIIADYTLVAITLMIAESRAEEKEAMVSLIMNFLH